MRPRISQKTALLLALIASVAVSACDDDGGTGPTPTIDITLSAPTLSVMQGESGTINLTLARGGGFAGVVTLAVEGAPAGVMVTAAPATIPAGSTSSVITIAAAASTVPGSYMLTVRATGQGPAAKTASIALTVTAAPVPSFTLAVSPTTVSVQQGTSGMATVTLTRTGGFTGGVFLTATGLPSGVTATFDPQQVTNTSTLTFSATASAAVGQATVTIHGAALSVGEQSTTLTLTVTAAPAGSGNTTWEFCSAMDMPLWLAVQDGAGAWTRVIPTGTKFQFDIASASGGVAYVSATTDGALASRSTVAGPVGSRLTRALRMKAQEAARNPHASPVLAAVDGFDLTIIYGTQAELNAQGTTQCLPGPGKTVNGTVSTLTGGQIVNVSLGDASVEVPPEGSAFQLLGVPDGALDLVAARGAFDPLDFTFPVDRLIIRRGLDQPDNSTLDLLDFSAAESFAPAQANITVGNIGNEVVLVTTGFFTASGTTGAPLYSGFGMGSGPFAYQGVPEDRQIAGDLHFTLVFALPDNEANDARIAGLFFAEPTDRTLTLGANLPTQTVTVAATAPYVRLRAQGAIATGYDKFVDVAWQQTTSTVLRSVSIGASSTYLANATTYDFTIPDFSATAGWDNNWALRAGIETDWAVTAAGFTGAGLISPRPMDGATIQGASRTGTIVP